MNNNRELDLNLNQESFNLGSSSLDIGIKGNIGSEKMLCSHCGRTSENDIRCLGICVADSEY